MLIRPVGKVHRGLLFPEKNIVFIMFLTYMNDISIDCGGVSSVSLDKSCTTSITMYAFI